MTDTLSEHVSFNAVIESVDGADVHISVPGNAYRLTFKWGGEAPPVTGRCKAVLRAHALRVHHATAGGRFVEPVSGAPRIVAGTIEAVDAESATVALRSVVPVHVALEHRDDLEFCMLGATVNFHVRSGAVLHPA